MTSDLPGAAYTVHGSCGRTADVVCTLTAPSSLAHWWCVAWQVAVEDHQTGAFSNSTVLAQAFELKLFGLIGWAVIIPVPAWCHRWPAILSVSAQVADPPATVTSSSRTSRGKSGIQCKGNESTRTLLRKQGERG